MKHIKALLDVETRLETEQVIATMVDWITEVHAANETSVGEVMVGFEKFVHAHCHEDFVYKILDPTGKAEPEVYSRDEFVGYFEQTSQRILALNRVPGLVQIKSREVDEEAGVETLTVRNKVWAMLLFAHMPDTWNGNPATQEWVFRRSSGDSEPWKLALWNDWPRMIPLQSAPVGTE